MMTHGDENGLTLLELLIVLAVISLLMGMVGVSIQQSAIGARIVLQRFSEELKSDLMACREHSVMTGRECSAFPTEQGYVVTIREGVRPWPDRITSTWTTPLHFRNGGPNAGQTFLLVGGRRQHVLTVEPYTGRIGLHAE